MKAIVVFTAYFTHKARTCIYISSWTGRHRQLSDIELHIYVCSSSCLIIFVSDYFCLTFVSCLYFLHPPFFGKMVPKLYHIGFCDPLLTTIWPCGFVALQNRMVLEPFC